MIKSSETTVKWGIQLRRNGRNHQFGRTVETWLLVIHAQGLETGDMGQQDTVEDDLSNCMMAILLPRSLMLGTMSVHRRRLSPGPSGHPFFSEFPVHSFYCPPRHPHLLYYSDPHFRFKPIFPLLHSPKSGFISHLIAPTSLLVYLHLSHPIPSFVLGNSGSEYDSSTHFVQAVSY